MGNKGVKHNLILTKVLSTPKISERRQAEILTLRGESSGTERGRGQCDTMVTAGRSWFLTSAASLTNK